MNPLPNYCFPGPATKFVDAFNLVNLSAAPAGFNANMTLFEAVNMSGGSFNQTLFHGTAALLNAGHTGVNFGATTAYCQSVMQQAFAGTITYSQAHGIFAALNSVEAISGCPLN
jgi:hypothetical protein